MAVLRFSYGAVVFSVIARLGGVDPRVEGVSGPGCRTYTETTDGQEAGVESLESGSGQSVPISVGRSQQGGLDPASWIPVGERGTGEPGVSVESFSSEVPDVPEFEKDLPMLRAGGTGQGCTYIAVAEPAPYEAMAWTDDGDGD